MTRQLFLNGCMFPSCLVRRLEPMASCHTVQHGYQYVHGLCSSSFVSYCWGTKQLFCFEMVGFCFKTLATIWLPNQWQSIESCYTPPIGMRCGIAEKANNPIPNPNLICIHFLFCNPVPKAWLPYNRYDRSDRWKKCTKLSDQNDHHISDHEWSQV